jgi:hypothetical protein
MAKPEIVEAVQTICKLDMFEFMRHLHVLRLCPGLWITTLSGRSTGIIPSIIFHTGGILTGRSRSSETEPIES